MTKPAKHHWTRAEKWLLAAPLLVLVCFFGMTTGKGIMRRKMGLPSRVIQLKGNVPLRLVATSHGGKIAISGNGTSPVEIYDVLTGDKIDELPIVSGISGSPEPSGISFVAEDRLAVAYYDRPLEIWDTKNLKVSRRFPFSSMQIAFSPDNRYLATSRDEIWDIQTGRLKHRLLKGSKKYKSFSPNGQLLAEVGLWGSDVREDFPGGDILLWNVSTGRLIKTIPSELAERVVFSPDGQQIACIEDVNYSNSQVVSGPNLRVFEVSSSRQVWRINIGDSSGRSPQDVKYSPDGDWLAVSTGNDTIELRSPSTGQLRGELHYHINDLLIGVVYKLRFTGDGKFLLMGVGREINIWNMDEVNAQFAPH